MEKTKGRRMKAGYPLALLAGASVGVLGAGANTALAKQTRALTDDCKRYAPTVGSANSNCAVSGSMTNITYNTPGIAYRDANAIGVSLETELYLWYSNHYMDRSGYGYGISQGDSGGGQTYAYCFQSAGAQTGFCFTDYH